MSPTPFEAPETTEEEILAATYRSLTTHGYAELTIKKIGEEFDKSPSLVYHHYENKDDLVIACLTFMLDELERELSTMDVRDPDERLEEFLAWVFSGFGESSDDEFMSLLVDLRARACHDPRYREYFTRSDRVFHDHLVAILEAGIETGDFSGCEPDRVASMIVTMLIGLFVRSATTTDDAWFDGTRCEVEAYIDAIVRGQDQA